ncbi:Protein of unknown function [Pyronema omphalodes CBS 100304]|uniref:Uncharacterized protein n=1 Tax=Pyronema omphalodes (strain CBS 100304) TaxID=1076935 RepID=U4LVA1_PYROM|nr:Protein of unknown function [Pyronema omphalodes CBS 100304]
MSSRLMLDEFQIAGYTASTNPTDCRFLVSVCLFSRPPRDLVFLAVRRNCPARHLGCLVRQSRFGPVNDGGLWAFTTVSIQR